MFKEFEELIKCFVVYGNIKKTQYDCTVERKLNIGVELSNVAVLESTQIFKMAKEHQYQSQLLVNGDIRIVAV